MYEQLSQSALSLKDRKNDGVQNVNNPVSNKTEVQVEQEIDQTPTPVSQDSTSGVEVNRGSILMPETDFEYVNLMSDVSNSLQDMMIAFSVFNDCSDRYSKLPSRYPTFDGDVEGLRCDIVQEQEYEESIFEELRNGCRALAEQAVVDCVKIEMPDLVRDAVINQVREEVDEQIGDHMPVSLKEQAVESKRQLEEIRVSLHNSEARINNSFIQISNLYDSLESVLTPDGSESPLYPPNVKSLLGYDLDSARSLNKDFGLAETEDLRVNFQQFLKHIGTSVDIVIP
ncbi:hypothetical protein CPB83DRAFT_857554 [Crepidotus variabilis]|uniref:Uncharacterized protein n=1 Tax=Crepidotus variabilis TaxID=179855 RepID=A0A9P6EBZ6_9AGAR|nr:hypothetical protein CPB83DRAFT_857554 [Crepidotus variabilis]